MMLGLKKMLPNKDMTKAETWFGVDQGSFSFKDSISPAYIKEEPSYLKLGENVARTLVVVNYPTKRVGNWLSDLYRFKGNLTISYHLVPVSPLHLRKSLNKSIDELKVRLLKPLQADVELETKRQLEAAKKLMEKLTSGESNNIFHVHLYLHLTASDLDELDRLTDNLMNKCYDVGMVPFVPEMNMLKAFSSVLPVNSLTLPEYTARNMDTEAASSFFPFDESEIAHDTGIVKGRNLTTDSLVIVDQFALPSHNEFVVGMTGTGKTFYLLKDMLRHRMQGYKIFAIDPEKNFSPVVKQMDGQVISISHGGDAIINPLEVTSFTLEGDEENEDRARDKKAKQAYLFNQKLQRLQVFFKLIKTDLSDLEAALIEDYLLKTYKEYKGGIDHNTDFSKLKSEDFPTLGDFYDKIDIKVDPELKNFKAILRVYVTGSNKDMFNGHTKIDLHSDLISFDLSNFEEGSLAQQAAMYTILSFIWDEITKDKETRCRLYVDEAHIMANPDNPRSMKFLYNVYKRIRNYKGGATIATQQVEDFLSAVEGERNYGKAIISNSISQLILGLKRESIEYLRKNDVMTLSEGEADILMRASGDVEKRGEGIYVVGNQRVHIQVDHTPQEMFLIDPKQALARYGEEGVR